MDGFNWIGIIIPLMLLAAPFGMAAVLIKDHVKAKRRHKRVTKPIRNWWEMEVK